MRERGLAGCQPRAYKRTTIRGENTAHSPDLICRDFTARAASKSRIDDVTCGFGVSRRRAQHDR